jgi:hypothetical protein
VLQHDVNSNQVKPEKVEHSKLTGLSLMPRKNDQEY